VSWPEERPDARRSVRWPVTSTERERESEGEREIVRVRERDVVDG
jgi:hypothetical protein